MDNTDDLNTHLRQLAETTLDAIKDTLGGEFEAVIIFMPSEESIELNEGKPIPCGSASTCSEEHTTFMVSTLFGEKEKPLIYTPDQKVISH